MRRAGGLGGGALQRLAIGLVLSAFSGGGRIMDLTSSFPFPVPDFAGLASIPEASSQLLPSSPEDLLCSHAPLSREDEASQVPFKVFLSNPELHVPRSPDRRLFP